MRWLPITVMAAMLLLYAVAQALSRVAVLQPPPGYVWRGPLTEHRLPLAQARAKCASMGARADSCSWKLRGRCYIVIPTNGPVRDLNQYRRHEMAHCANWEH